MKVNPRGYPASEMDVPSHRKSKKCKFERQDITFTYETGKTQKGG